MHQRARSEPGVKVLTQLPGVGPFTAMVLLAEVGDVSRFGSARKLAAWAGLTPTVRGSDRTVRQGHISQAGPWPGCGGFLCEAAQTAKRHPDFPASYQAIARRRSNKIATTAVARKLLAPESHGRDRAWKQRTAVALRAGFLKLTGCPLFRLAITSLGKGVDAKASGGLGNLLGVPWRSLRPGIIVPVYGHTNHDPYVLREWGTGMLSLSVAASATSADSTASQVSSILNAIAPYLWVAVVVLAIVIFRKPLSAAIGRVSEVEVGSTKVVLQDQADNAANIAKQVAAKTKQAAPSVSQEITGADDQTKQAISQATSKASSDPPGAMLSAWRAVEAISGATPTGQDHGVMSPSVPEVVNELTKNKRLDSSASSLVPVAQTLESLRKMAARNPKAITPATATSFVSAAADLADVIAQAGALDKPA